MKTIVNQVSFTYFKHLDSFCLKAIVYVQTLLATGQKAS